MSIFGLDAATLRVLGGFVVIATPAAITGAYQVRSARRAATAQVEAARIAATTAATTQATAIAQTAKTEAEHIAEDRAGRVSKEMDSLIAGLNGLVASQGVQIERLWKEVQSAQEAITAQRRDMTAIAEEKAELTHKVYMQGEKIADLQTADLLKTNLLNRLQTKLSSAFDYIQTLTQQLIDHGHEPHPIPPDLRDRK